MPTIEYKTFICFHDELEARLNELGNEGWRLHTCDPVVTMGQHGSGTVQAFVVLDRVVPEDQEYASVDNPDASEGLAMKG